jgi:peptidoglycan hydrolase-like protein with peptidoglycan-binding domain
MTAGVLVRPRSRRRAIVAGGVIATALAVAAGIAIDRSLGGSGTVGPPARVATARVERSDLESTTQVAGALGFAGSVTVIGSTPGATVTWLPAPGREIRRGDRVYEVDGRAVPLFLGRRPAWRVLSVGVTRGRDVAQLEANLVRLGYADRAVLTIDRRFTWQTAAAVRRWQTARGVTATGSFAPGDVVYARGPLRVKHVTAQLGGAPQPGLPLLTATSTARQVTASLPVSLEPLVHVHDPVTITLPDGSSATRGRITSVGRVATAPPDDQGPGGGPPSAAPATVSLRVRLVDARAGGAVDAAPVTVNITSGHARNVLAVPIGALVALAGGGYAVEVLEGAARRLVAVQTGLFADTRVEVKGAGLAPGTRVQVPAA